MAETISYRFRLRRRLAAAWAALNEILLDSEIGLASDTRELKVGDGATPWNTLPYLERGMKVERMGDVDPAAKADGFGLVWNAAAGKHIYSSVGDGGGGGSSGNVTPDTHPSTANALDDEFEAGSLDAKWTWRNQGTATATLSKGALRLKGAATNHSPITRGLQIIEQTVSGDFKVQAKFQVKGPAQYNGGGLCLVESGTGKCHRFGVGYGYASGTNPVWSVEYYSSVTTFGSTLYTSGSLAPVSPTGLIPFFYYEIERSGATLSYRVSATGEDDTWVTMYSVAQTTHFTTAPDRVGLYVESISATQAVLICDWFRRIS